MGIPRRLTGIFAATLLFAEVAGQVRAAETVDTILAKYVEAIGGEAANRKQTTRKLEGTLLMGENAKPWKMIITQKAPNLRHVKIDIPGHGVVTEGYDGKVAWRHDPGAGTQQIHGDELVYKKYEAEFYAGVEFSKHHKKVVLAPQETLNGNACHVIKGVRDDGKETTLYINATTFLIDRMIMPAPDPRMPPFTVDISDYREVDGIQMAHAFTVLNQGQPFMKAKFDRVVHGVAVDNALFAMPGKPALEVGQRSPVLQRFCGTWESVVTNLMTNREDPKAIKTRKWSRNGEGNILLEQELVGDREVAYLMYAYDPRTDTYRGTYTGRNFLARVTGKWDEAKQTMTWDLLSVNKDVGGGYHKFLDKDHIMWEISFRDPKGEMVFNARGKEKRIAPVEDLAVLPKRPEGFRILDALVGNWTTYLNNQRTGETIRNTSTSRWSRDGRGLFLLTSERGSRGEKQTIMTYDPDARALRGCFVEQGAAGFINGRFHRERRMMEQAFYMFELPRDATGKIIQSASFEDGVNGRINFHFIERHWARMKMDLLFGRKVVWEGYGKIVREGEK